MNREKPITFSTPMVQAILDGRKSMTRRVVKSSMVQDTPWDELPRSMNTPPHHHENDGKFYVEFQSEVDDTKHYEIKCPYQVGDVLWVKEIWTQLDMDYRVVTGKLDITEFKGCPIAYKTDGGPERVFWRSSRFMPRAASRLFLKVKNIRIERLQDITAKDIRAEGLTSMAVHCLDYEIAVKEWQLLWDKLNSKRGFGWDNNPWCWVVEFERVEKQ